MRHDVRLLIALVDLRLENLHALARDFGSFQTPDQFLALAGKHGPHDNFDPPHVSFYDIHLASSPVIAMPQINIPRQFKSSKLAKAEPVSLSRNARAGISSTRQRS